jgi:beta-lactamase superfamily II metal-dependent hydrolase
MRSFYWILLVLLIAANVLFYKDVFAPAVLTVRVLDVGKGGATLVQTPSGKTLLIDTGPDASVLRALGTVLPMWQRSIDAVVLTSSAHSATGGLPEVQSRYRIRNLIRSDSTEENVSLGEGIYIKTLSSPKGAPILRVSYGSTTLNIASSTPAGVYISDGRTVSTK